jgi:hypothetical protein
MKYKLQNVTSRRSVVFFPKLKKKKNKIKNLRNVPAVAGVAKINFVF